MRVRALPGFILPTAAEARRLPTVLMISRSGRSPRSFPIGRQRLISRIRRQFLRWDGLRITVNRAVRGPGPTRGRAYPIAREDARTARPWTFPPEEPPRSEEHTSELQSRENLVCRLLLE